MNNTVEIVEDEQCDFRPMLPFYVYVLLDPNDKSVFYVGKGTGVRVLNHVAEVRALLAKEVSGDTAKQRKIHELLASDSCPIELIVGRFETEAEAFAVEAVLINHVHDFTRLTNISRGHGAEYIREYGNYGPIEGIDLPKPVRVSDGSFRDKNLHGLSQSDAYSYLTALKNMLTAGGFDWRDFSAKEDRPFAPGEANGHIGVLIRIGGVDFIVSFSKTCRPNLSVATTPSTRHAEGNDFLEKIGRELGGSCKLDLARNTLVRGVRRFRPFVTRKIFQSNEANELIETLTSMRALA
jgi:hypothetical protein